MMMTNLIEYIRAFAERGACRCGKCVDAPANPDAEQPQGHTANVEFFEVSAREGADAEALRSLVVENKKGVFTDVDLFDGKEHNYIEIGGWVGDQGFALMLMGLGARLGLWQLLTPSSMMGALVPKDLAMQMAGAGMVAIQSTNPSLQVDGGIS